jgi:hypothetical protein
VILNEAVVPIAKRQAGLGSKLCAAIDISLSNKPSTRPQDGKELLAMFSAAMTKEPQ